MMHEVELERHAQVPLIFTGELIAEVSTEPDGNDRWEEWRVWRLEPNSKVGWVVQRLGKSRVPGEVDVIHTFKCKYPLDVRQRLHRQDPRDKQRWYMTDSAFETLELAARADDRLAFLLVERI